MHRTKLLCFHRLEVYKDEKSEKAKKFVFAEKQDSRPGKVYRRSTFFLTFSQFNQNVQNVEHRLYFQKKEDFFSLSSDPKRKIQS